MGFRLFARRHTFFRMQDWEALAFLTEQTG